MHIVTLADKAHFDYLMYVFHKHVTGGVDPDELSIASQVWLQLKDAKEFNLPDQSPDKSDQPEVVRIDGPLSIVHEGDLNVPIPESLLNEDKP